MPQVAAAAIISAIGATGAVATAITIGVNLAFAAGVSAVAQAFAPQTRAAEGRPTEWTPDPNAPIPFVFGRRGVAGTVVHQDAYGPDNRYLGRVTIYSGGGPINAYSTFLLNGTAQTFTGELMDGTPVNRLWRQTKLGAQPDTALTSPSVSGSYTMSGWTSSHKLSGYACSMITLRQDGDFEYWPNGIPKIIQVLQGMLSYDPRLDSTYPGGSGTCRLATPSTWVYSTNPIIAALKWALGIKHNGVLVGGIGSSVDGIDVDAFIAAANIADTNGWTVSAVAYSDAPSGDDKYQVLEALLQAGGAVPARKQGKISCVSRANAPSSVVTISAADTAGPFEYVPSSRRDRRINTVIPRCVQEDHNWELVDLEPVTDSTYSTEDGATRSRGVTYAYVSDADQAAQLAAYDVANSREWEPFTIPLKPYLRDLDPGDAFTITDSDLGISGQKFLVLARSYDPATDRVEVTCTTETNAKHAWALGLTGTAPASPTLGYSDPLTIPTPSGSNWSLAAGTGETPSVVVTGAVPSTVTVSKIVAEVKTNAGSTWTPLGEYPTSTTKIEAPGLLASTSYVVRLTYRSMFGSLGSSLTLGPVTTGAAEISGQGTLATLNQVSLGASGQVVREDGSTKVTDSTAITSLGTAAAISGQGALATLGQVNFGASGRVYRDDGTARVTDSLAITSLGTAAAISGQGALATLGQVNLGASGRVYRDDGVTRLTDSLAVTSLGTAAAISGQGALATKSTVDSAEIASGAATRVFNYADDTSFNPSTTPSGATPVPSLLYEDTFTTGAGECVLWLQWEQTSVSAGNQAILWLYVDDTWDHDGANVIGYTDYYSGASANGGQTASFQVGSLTAASHTVRVYVYKTLSGSLTISRVRGTLLNSIR